MYNLEIMCVKESSDVVLDEVKVTNDVEIYFDDEWEEMFMKPLLFKNIVTNHL